MDYLRIVILGVVQGITEFLPVSSDGHLAVANALFSAFSGDALPEDNLAVTIILHMGTLLAILIVYWQHIWRLLFQDRRVIGLLIVGTIPAAIVGLLLKRYFEKELTSLLVTGVLLPFNGLMLLWIGRKKPGDVPYQEMSYPQALFVGICQAFAPLPGISRSGTTITGGLACGLRRDAAATFSFLLAIPAIGGAGVLELKDLITETPSDLPPAAVLLVGAAVSFVVGYASLRLLLRLLREGILDPFGYWCIALGLGVIVWQLVS
ncbi:MAG: undecaprenyl-diphosphate phosphatase [Planctomycetia bacterium]|nr:undecaprenyl-diphosphate phosphatase [Planctomycetia bacterium]